MVLVHSHGYSLEYLLGHHRCGPNSIPGLGRGRMCVKFHQLLAVGRGFPPGTPVSSTRKLISSSFHRLDMTLAVAEALNPNKPKPSLDINGHYALGGMLTVSTV